MAFVEIKKEFFSKACLDDIPAYDCMPGKFISSKEDLKSFYCILKQTYEEALIQEGNTITREKLIKSIEPLDTAIKELEKEERNVKDE